MNPIDALANALANARRFDGRRDDRVGRLRWPGGAGLAISFVLNIEESAEWSMADVDALNEAVHEVTLRLDGGPDDCLGTHFDCGARAGSVRIVQRLTDAGLPLTLNVCGRALERTPWVEEDARRHGFELCGHGWRWASPASMDEASERTAIAGTVATLESLAGKAPVGWHCKGSRSPHTHRLLREAGGFLFDSDNYGDDLPSLLALGDGGPAHVVLPYAFDTNDMRFFGRGGFVHAADFSGQVGDALTALLTESRTVPRMLTVGLHSRIIGRPGRVAGLDRLLQQITGLGDRVRVMTREDIARHWLQPMSAP